MSNPLTPVQADTREPEVPQEQAPPICFSIVPVGEILSPNLAKHLKEYALVRTASNAVHSLPLYDDFTLLCAPVASAIKRTQPMKLVLDQSDRLGDAALSKLDCLIPSLKTVEIQDLTDPVVQPLNAAIAGIHATVDTAKSGVGSTIVQPAQKLAGDVRSSLTTSDGKCVITASVDPIVAPINQNLESFVESVSPKSKKVAKEGFSSELSRTFEVFKNVVTRAKESSTSPIEDVADSPQVERAV